MTIIFIIIILIFVSAFFSMSETGVTGANSAKIYKLKMEGNKRAKKLIKLMKKKDRLITTILLGNNAVNTAAAAVTTSLFIGLYGDSAETILISTVVVTIALLIFAEIFPKVFALKNSERVALFAAPIISVLSKIFYPIIVVVEKIAKILLKLAGEGDSVGSLSSGSELLKGTIEYHHNKGDVVKDEKDMLGSILDLDNTDISEIMQHRKDMRTLDIALPTSDLVKEVLKSQYSRIPIYSENPDNIIGILYSKTLMRELNSESNKGKSDINIKNLLVEPWFVPESNTLKDQLFAFKEKHKHFALVVDEYGSLEGLITLEDILEEIVGNIEDEYDLEYHLIEDNYNGSYIIDGTLPVRDLNREMSWSLPTDKANTVAGLLIDEAQMIPYKGQVFNYYGFRFEVLKKKRNQILKIQIQKLEP